MTGSHRNLGLVLALATFAAPTLAHAAPTSIALKAISWSAIDDVQDLFNQGVELLRRGKDDEALKAFQMVLAKDPSNQQAYELWKTTDHQIWLDILVKQGDFELIAKRLMGLAEMGRTERKNDAEAIKAALAELRSDQTMAFRKARNTLAAEHGEYAVPYMLPSLADQGNDDRRVIYMQTLTEMDRDVVIPLIEALNSPDAFLRRNVALTLGYIGDPRAAGMLAHLAKSDPDGGVQQAATEALAKCKSSGNALAEFLNQGEAYALRMDSVLAAHQYSDVVWSWSEAGLTSMGIPREVYGDEMSKKNYSRALAVDPNSLTARAGLARAYAAQGAKLAALKASGKDVAGMDALMDSDALGLGLVGADAIDAALARAVSTGDTTAGLALIHALAMMPNAPSGALNAALASKDGAMRSEAAVALGQQAVRSRTPASGAVIAALGEAAGREVVRTVFVIDARAEVRNAALAEIEKLGFAAMGAERGANALALLHRAPGVDAVLVGESLPDLTTFQVIDDLRAEPRYETTPIYVLAANAEQAKEIFGEKATGVVASSGDMAQLIAAMGALTGDRATADALAAKACATLSQIAAAGGNISAALPGLVSTLAHREDPVTVQALATLGQAGDAGQVSPIVAVLTDAKRSEVARSAAADALANIFSRGAVASAEDTAAIEATLTSDAPAGVRSGAARALGAMRLAADARARMLRSTRTAPAAQN